VTGTVYAIDAFAGNILWTRKLPQGTYYCGDTPGVPSVPPAADNKAVFGVQGTPAIDRDNNWLYVPDGVHKIHALDLGTGQDVWSVDIAPGSNDASNLHQFAHTAVTYVKANHTLYAGTGSTCDISPWKGRVAAVDVSSRTLTNTFYPTWGYGGKAYSGGGIWGWGGVSTDGTALWAGVGNADTEVTDSAYVATTDESAGYGEHVVKLSLGLGATALDYNLPPVVPNPIGGDLESATDIDLAGTPVLFQPPGCPALLAVQGKGGYLLIYRRDNLVAGPIATFPFSWSNDVAHYIGNAAYSSKTGYLYASVPTNTGRYVPGMAILAPTNGCSSFGVVQQPVFGIDSFVLGAAYTDTAEPRSTPTVVNDVVFMGTPDGTLWARNATTGAPLWNRLLANNDQIRFGPAVTGGWAYVVGMNSGTLYAFSVPQSLNQSQQRHLLQLRR
jgi:hypothetical protein